MNIRLTQYRKDASIESVLIPTCREYKERQASSVEDTQLGGSIDSISITHVERGEGFHPDFPLPAKQRRNNV